MRKGGKTIFTVAWRQAGSFVWTIHTRVQVRRARKDANIRTGGMDSSATVKSPIAKGSGDHTKGIFFPHLQRQTKKNFRPPLQLRILVVCSVNKSLHSPKTCATYNPFLCYCLEIFASKSYKHCSPFSAFCQTFTKIRFFHWFQIINNDTIITFPIFMITIKHIFHWRILMVI